MAATVTAVTALVVTFAAKAGFHGARPAYGFFLTVITVIFLIVYVVVCVATIVFFLTKVRNEFRPLLHVVVPVVALCILVPAVYYSLKGLSFPANAAIPAVVAWVALGGVVLVMLRARGVDISAEGQRWLHDDTNEPVSAGS
jgi:amino acid transporter